MHVRIDLECVENDVTGDLFGTVGQGIEDFPVIRASGMQVRNVFGAPAVGVLEADPGARNALILHPPQRDFLLGTGAYLVNNPALPCPQTRASAIVRCPEDCCLMPRQLLILRHGKSDWGVDVDDFDRPLRKRGRRGAKVIGKWLLENDLVPDRVCSSPAVRAIDTAVRTCKSAGFDINTIVRVEPIYEAHLDDLLRVLSGCGDQTRRVMIVGHNPGLEDLLLYLTGGHIPIPEDGKYLPTAALAVLDMPDAWQDLEAGSAQLHQLLRAKDLMPMKTGGESEV